MNSIPITLSDQQQTPSHDSHRFSMFYQVNSLAPDKVTHTLAGMRYVYPYFKARKLRTEGLGGECWDSDWLQTIGASSLCLLGVAS